MGEGEGEGEGEGGGEGEGKGEREISEQETRIYIQYELVNIITIFVYCMSYVLYCIHLHTHMNFTEAYASMSHMYHALRSF